MSEAVRMILGQVFAGLAMATTFIVYQMKTPKKLLLSSFNPNEVRISPPQAISPTKGGFHPSEGRISLKKSDAYAPDFFWDYRSKSQNMKNR